MPKMRPITSQRELAVSVSKFWEAAQPASADHATFLEMLKQGRNFVCSADRAQFAPSRFAGYRDNTFVRHALNKAKDGGVTDKAITNILGKRISDQASEEAYHRVCQSFGITLSKTERRYWVLSPLSLVQSPSSKSLQGSRNVDRDDPQDANAVFRHLVPEPALLTVAAILARAIEVAHNAEPKAWSISLFPEKIRLNVGQVEVLTMRPGTLRLITSIPKHAESHVGLTFKYGSRPVFSSVPVPSGVLDADLATAVDIPNTYIQSLHKFIVEAANRKRGSPFRRAFSVGILLFLERAIGRMLPRPDLPGQFGPLPPPDHPDEVLTLEPLVEGAVRTVVVNAFERDTKARRRCLEHYGCACCICGMSFGATYGPAVDGFIHVHHLRPLSGIRQQYVVDPVADLRPVCPNCHAVLHHRAPELLTIDEARAMLGRSGSA